MCCKESGPERRVAIFAGTVEGRELAEFVVKKGLSDSVDFFVATEYGQELLEEEGSINVHWGRLDREGMCELFRTKGITMVIDTTHPYAAEVTGNIRNACEKEKIAYVRLLRSTEESSDSENIIFADSVKEAAETVDRLGVKTLVTTGSKEIGTFNSVNGVENLIVARVLPVTDSIRACVDAGVSTKNIIGMQGPFTLDMNLATLKQYGCEALVTKDTGRAGGFDDKIKCAEEGYKVIVVRRPLVETGVNLEEAEKLMEEHLR